MSTRDKLAFATALLLGAHVHPATHYYVGEDNRGRMMFRLRATGKRTPVQVTAEGLRA